MGFGLVLPDPFRASIKAFSMKISSSNSNIPVLKSQVGGELGEKIKTQGPLNSNPIHKGLQWIFEEKTYWGQLGRPLISTPLSFKRLIIYHVESVKGGGGFWRFHQKTVNTSLSIWLGRGA
jgi:hypothetical protein